MKRTNVLIVILGGGLVCDRGRWRPTTFFEKNDFQRLGDNYRIFAAVELYKKFIKKNFIPTLFASGEKGVSKNPDHPIIADIYKRELEFLGIPKHSIFKDRNSGKSFEQLLYIQSFISRKRFDLLSIVSNKYHLPRVRAMIKYAPNLPFLKKKLNEKVLNLISAESVLLGADVGRWKKEIDSIYKSAFMIKRIRAERSGIKEIINKTYHW